MSRAGAAWALLLTAQCVGMSDGERDGGGPETSQADTPIVAAQEALTESLIELSGVVGTAVGLCDGEPCIKVYLAAPSAELLERIPDTYRGHLVDVEVTGEIRARDDTIG